MAATGKRDFTICKYQISLQVKASMTREEIGNDYHFYEKWLSNIIKFVFYVPATAEVI